ncbi:MAG: cation:dicarboxylase symporter family transporter [Hyphomonadaceae bacterium]|nr:cation:dicarboxylase symporter family transporter [Hyphomonadaceae bacterium]
MKLISFLVLAALIAGLAAGAGVRAADNPTLTAIAGYIEPFGGLWLNALRMTVVPLVVALLITGIGSVGDAAKTGGLVLRAILLFTVLIFFAALYVVGASSAFLSAWPVDRAQAEAFLGGIGANAVTISEPPTFASWIQSLAPANPVRAAAEDAILALVVFALFFGFATTRLAAPMRDQIVGFFRAVSEAMIIIVQWILVAGPVGVFALALGVGLHAGFAAAGTLAQYVVIVTTILAGGTLLAWLIGVAFSGQPIGRFTSALAPVWAVAASTQSSLASLPVMLNSALRGLDVPPHIADVVLPLAVATFRFTSPIGNLAVVFFVAHLYGIEPSALQIIGAVVVAYAVSIAAVGLPGQISFIASIAPISIAMGVPVEPLGVLIAVEVIPDIFRTLGNTTADVSATAMLSRGQAKRES